jgi:hypothetical protein
MFKNIFFAILFISALGLISPAGAQKTKQGSATPAKNDVKFLEDISIEIPAQNPAGGGTQPSKPLGSEPVAAVNKTISIPGQPDIEEAGTLQFKYAQLMDLEVEEVRNLSMFRIIDEWLGTKYKLGGSTREGIDCSAFMQVLFSSLYSISLPRTAKEQFGFTRRISRAELREGDLVFFNTVGGVSHVGMYLQNNKFVHASSGGVTISDLFEDYWMKKFVGVGRIDRQPAMTALSSRP